MNTLFPAIRDLTNVRRRRLSYDIGAAADMLSPLVKAHLRLATDAEDQLVKTYTAAAIGIIEEAAGIAIANQVHEWTISCSEPGTLQVFPGPIVTATVDGQDADVIHTGAAHNPYGLIAVGVLDAAPVNFTAGATVVDDIDPVILQAVLVTAAHLYENREFAAPGAFGRIPMAAEMLLAPYRNVVLGV
jgi:uncharacterized phiE125 gp8 family phage protein